VPLDWGAVSNSLDSWLVVIDDASGQLTYIDQGIPLPGTGLTVQRSTGNSNIASIIVSGGELDGKMGPSISPYDAEKIARMIQEF